MHDTETLSVGRILNKEYFYGKIMQKICTKSKSQTLFNFGKSPKTSMACLEFLLKIRYKTFFELFQKLHLLIYAS